MTEQEAGSLKPGDRILVAELVAVVMRLNRFSGPMGTPGPLSIEFEFEGGGGAGCVSGDFIADLKLLERKPPDWYGLLEAN